MERQGWRCQVISEWHRARLGADCLAVDLDFVLVEYSSTAGCPAAIMEYKHVGARPSLPDSPNYRALSRLATASDIPAFIIRYDNNLASFDLTPLNKLGHAVIAKWCGGLRSLTEGQFLALHTRLRRRVAAKFRRRTV